MSGTNTPAPVAPAAAPVASAPAPAENASVPAAAPAPADNAPATTQDLELQQIDQFLSDTPAQAAAPAAPAAMTPELMASMVAQAVAASQPQRPAVDPAMQAMLANQQQMTAALQGLVPAAPAPVDPLAAPIDSSVALAGLSQEVVAQLQGAEGMSEAMIKIADNIAKARAGSVVAPVAAPQDNTALEGLRAEMTQMREQSFNNMLASSNPELAALVGTPQYTAFMSQRSPYSASHTNETFFKLAAQNMDVQSAVNMLGQIPQAASPAALPVSPDLNGNRIPATQAQAAPVSPGLYQRLLREVELGNKTFEDLKKFEDRMGQQTA